MIFSMDRIGHQYINQLTYQMYWATPMIGISFQPLSSLEKHYAVCALSVDVRAWLISHKLKFNLIIF